MTALLCANADGSHMTKPLIIGKSKNPRAIKNIKQSLTAHYNNSRKAWMTADIMIDWFHHKLVPEIRRFQIEELKIPASNVKAIVIIDNCPAHPPEESALKTVDGKISCMFLPPNTTSILQPIDQGIYAVKRLYKKKFLNDVLVVEIKDGEDTRGAETLENLKNYTLKNMIYKFMEAVKEVTTKTLSNGWKKLLINEDTELVIENCETEDSHQILQHNNEMVTLEDVDQW